MSRTHRSQFAPGHAAHRADRARALDAGQWVSRGVRRVRSDLVELCEGAVLRGETQGAPAASTLEPMGAPERALAPALGSKGRSCTLIAQRMRACLLAMATSVL